MKLSFTPRLAPDVIDRVVRLVGAGKTAYEVWQLTGVKIATVRRYADELGLALTPGRRGRKAGSPYRREPKLVPPRKTQMTMEELVEARLSDRVDWSQCPLAARYRRRPL